MCTYQSRHRWELETVYTTVIKSLHRQELGTVYISVITQVGTGNCVHINHYTGGSCVHISHYTGGNCVHNSHYTGGFNTVNMGNVYRTYLIDIR